MYTELKQMQNNLFYKHLIVLILVETWLIKNKIFRFCVRVGLNVFISNKHRRTNSCISVNLIIGSASTPTFAAFLPESPRTLSMSILHFNIKLRHTHWWSFTVQVWSRLFLASFSPALRS